MLKQIIRKCNSVNPNLLLITRNCHNEARAKDESYDIVITGGGMVGTTLAVALANNRRLESKSILLLEGSKQYEYQCQEKYSNRVVALNQQTRTLLSSIGAWQHIENTRYAPVRKMQVWDACSEAMITFNEDHLDEEFAYIVENDLLLDAVSRQLQKHSSIKVIHNARVENISLPRIPGEDAKVVLQNGDEFGSKLLTRQRCWSFC